MLAGVKQYVTKLMKLCSTLALSPQDGSLPTPPVLHAVAPGDDAVACVQKRYEILAVDGVRPELTAKAVPWPRDF